MENLFPWRYPILPAIAIYRKRAGIAVRKRSGQAECSRIEPLVRRLADLSWDCLRRPGADKCGLRSHDLARALRCRAGLFEFEVAIDRPSTGDPIKSVVPSFSVLTYVRTEDHRHIAALKT